jgi:hypothetical protein
VSVLDADIALAFCIFVAVGLRAFIVGERFDRALHRIDPTYRNTRDMTRGLLVDPVDSLKGLPKAYGRYSGVTFRPVADPEVERLRRRAVRTWVESAVFSVGGMAAVGVVGALLRRISTGLDIVAVLVVLALLGLYWLRRLSQERRDPDKSTTAALYMLGGVATALAAFIFVVSFPSRLA